jgi:hypothetical protein
MTWLPAIAACLLAAAPVAGGPGEPVLRSGKGFVPLDVAVELAPAGPGDPLLTLAWRQDGGAAVAEARDAIRQVEIRLAPRGAGVALELRVRYLADVGVEREAVRLRLPGAGLALRRDLSWSSLRRPMRVDRGTPILAAVGDVLVAGGPGFVAARYAPAVRAEAGREGPAHAGVVDVELVLDDEAAHPFAVYERCMPKLPLGDDGQVAYAGLERKRLEARTPRRAGEESRGRATLYLLRPGEVRIPLVVERWPAGASAAVVFTDHADRTDPEALRAVLLGDSRPVCRAAGPGGFLGRDLRLTKSFFVRARYGGLEDPETAALARELARAGSEIASHSPTAAPDEREASRPAVATLRRFGAVTWIDHQPYTNCEALSAEGWRADGPYAIRDLLASAGFRWVWEAGDVAGFAERPAVVNLFLPERPAAPPPAFPLPFDPRLWAFGSTMFQGAPEALGRALSDEALGHLEAERGLFVAHTYLSASPRTTGQPALLGRLVVRPVPGGLEIDPAFDAGLARLAARVDAGAVASLTWDEAGSRLRALGDLEVEYAADGSAAVSNRGAEALLGLTLGVAVPLGTLEADGVPVHVARDEGPVRAWLDLPAGRTVVVRATDGASRVPFFRPVPASAGVEPRAARDLARSGAGTPDGGGAAPAVGGPRAGPAPAPRSEAAGGGAP